VQTLETPPNPQFIAFDRQQKFLYSVHGDGTEVSSYAIDKASGRINFLNKQPTNGYNSTHLTPDPTNRYIVIGNGIGVAAFPINLDGSLAPYTDMVRAGAMSVRTAIRLRPVRIRIMSGSIRAGAFFLRRIAAPIGPTFIAWTLRAASLSRTIPLSPGAAPEPDRVISPSIRPSPGPTSATSFTPPSPPIHGIPSAERPSLCR